MLLIILMHSIDHTGVLEASSKAGIGTFVLVRFLYMLTQISVNCYVMLSGYFLVRSRFRLKKIVELWLEVAFYSFVIKLIFMLTREIPFSAVALLSCFFPILTGRYWFIAIYIGMYLLSPFLNIAIRAMDKKTHGLLILTLGLLFSAWSSIHPSFAGMNSGGGWGLAWFVLCPKREDKLEIAFVARNIGCCEPAVLYPRRKDLIGSERCWYLVPL